MKKFLIITAILIFSVQSVAYASFTPTKPKPPRSKEMLAQGKEIYFERCSYCHGMEGGGDGPAAEFLDPRPRNFKSNTFKFRSTESGALPLDEDLFLTISRGIQGTAMQIFDKDLIKTGLTEEQRWAVIYWIQTFRLMPDFSLWDMDYEACGSKDPDMLEDCRDAKVMKIGKAPPSSPEIIAKGAEVYKAAKCFQCHGDRGLGNGVSVKGMVDDWKFPIVPRDLTKGWKYKAGTTVEEIFSRFTTGLNGTPMPSFAGSIKEEDRWAIAHFVKSLIIETDQKLELAVKKIEGKLPETADDPAWEQSDQIDVWLTGNVLIKPRWQNIKIDMVHVKALFNEEEIVFRMQWNDRFEDRTHDGHNDMHQTDKTKPGETGNTQTYVPIYDKTKYNPGTYRDGLMLQFPNKIPVGMTKPHFLNGSSGNSVNLWWWRADYDKDPSKGRPVLEMNATGFKKAFKVQPDASQEITHQAEYKDGIWTLVMKRKRFTDNKRDIKFEAGKFIPIAVNAWDGFNKDIGMQKSISTWYFVYLEKPMEMKVYLIALGAIVLVGASEVLLMRKFAKDD